MTREQFESYISKQSEDAGGHWTWLGPAYLWMEGKVTRPARAVCLFLHGEREVKRKLGEQVNTSSWESKLQIPGMVPARTCGDPSCVRPTHLEFVTRETWGKRHANQLAKPFVKGGWRKRQ